MATVFSSPSIPHSAAPLTLVPTGFPVSIQAPHGGVTVQARYFADQWHVTFPSRSHPGELHTASNGRCDCPSYKTCWHLKAIASVTSKLHEVIQLCLADLGNSQGSIEDAYHARQALARMGIATRAQAMAALEAQS